MRGPGGFHGGRVSDALVSQIDLFPTICELAGIERPDWLQGRSLLPLDAPRGRRGQRRGLRRDHLPRRLRAAARGPHPALQVHPPLRRAACRRCSPTSTTARRKDLLLAARLGRARAAARGSSTTCCFDPHEADNLVGDPALRRRRSTSCARGWTTGCARPTTRCSTARSRRRRAPSSTTRRSSRRTTRRSLRRGREQRAFMWGGGVGGARRRRPDFVGCAATAPRTSRRGRRPSRPRRRCRGPSCRPWPPFAVGMWVPARYPACAWGSAGCQIAVSAREARPPAGRAAGGRSSTGTWRTSGAGPDASTSGPGASASVASEPSRRREAATSTA